MKSVSFYRKVLICFLIIGTIPAISIGIITSTLMTKMTQERLLQESSRTLSNTLFSIETTLDNYCEILDEFSKDSFVLSLLKKKYLEDEDFVKFHEQTYAISSGLSKLIYDSDNRETAETSFSKPISNVHIIRTLDNEVLSLQDTPDIYNFSQNRNWGFFRKAQETDFPIIYPAKYTAANSLEIAAVAIQAIYENENLLGFLAFDIPLEALTFQTTKNTEMLPINFSLFTTNNYILWDNNDFSSMSNFVSLPSEIKKNTSGYLINDENGYRNLLSFQYSKQYDLILLGGFNMDLILGNLDIIGYILIITICITVIVCIIFALVISKALNTPLKNIISSMEEMENGNFDVKIEINGNDEFSYVAKQFNSMTSKIKELFQKDHEKQELLRAAEIQNLKSQINPHFISNTLDSIKYLAKIDGNEEIFIMTKSLSSLLKNSFRTSEEFVTIQACLKSLDDYIAIQKIRFQDKFDVIKDFQPEILDYKIPSLLLQPIVENAMLHGLEPSPHRGLLTIIGYQENKLIFIKIADNGVGMSQKKCEELMQPVSKQASSLHIGLQNIHQRIQLYYGTEYGISLNSAPQKGTAVTICLPYQEETNDSMYHCRR